ncbi:MAG: CHAT domain-containing protein, partial [Prochloraceae cyanobacterium]|nr:CHAT domain-containing protein [Prochloraceae cyanobacterium]
LSALRSSNRQQDLVPLISKYEIVHAPSSSTIAIARQFQKQQQPSQQIAIFADPVFSSKDERLTSTIIASSDKRGSNSIARLALERAARDLDVGVWQRLPGTRNEAEAILKLVSPQQEFHVFDFDANLDAATKTKLDRYRIVHFATHGLLDTKSPELSGLVLSLVDRQGNGINGFLRLHEIFNLDLNADLVILSACQTGLGQNVRGEGLVGLTRGFMYAGTPRVVVSLWSVADEATAEFMSRFYTNFLKKGLTATEALRATQLEMQQETKWKSPYFWAAFTLQGEWR